MASRVPDASGVATYEAQFARIFAKEIQAFAFWKGRVALHAILEALDVGRGDQVIVPGFTCVVVPNAVLYRGARPVYVDIEPNSFTMDAKDIHRNITTRTKAIIVQHSYGIPADMDAILEVASKAKIAIIEDCAHALGSTYRGKSVGSIGNAAFFSSQWSKPYTTGLGGMAVATEKELCAKLRAAQNKCCMPSFKEVSVLRLQLKIHQKLFSPRLFWKAMKTLKVLSNLGVFIGSSSEEELIGEKPVGYEKRMSEFQASCGLNELLHLKENMDARDRLTIRYDQLLADAGLKAVTIPPGVHAVLVRYPLLVKNKAAMLAEAERQSIELGSWFDSPLHPEGSPLERLGYSAGQCPVAEHVVRHVVNLPLHKRVSDDDAVRTVKFITNMRRRGYV